MNSVMRSANAITSLAPLRSFGPATVGTTGYTGHLTAPTGEARWQVTRPLGLEGLGFETEVRGHGYRLLFSSDDLAVATAKRALGCVIMALIPEEGLDEVLSELKGTCEFYLEDRSLHPVAPLTIVGEGIGVGTGDDD
jgi:hypothetical protein